MNNIEINITENGTTTLATVGKFCDRNIDVTVNVPTSGGSIIVDSDAGAADGNGYFIITTQKTLNNANTYFELDLSDYISSATQITSIFAVGGNNTSEAATAYWNRALSPDGKADVFVGTQPNLMRRERTDYYYYWDGINNSGTTIKFYNYKVTSQKTVFDRFLIRYNMEV